MSAWPWLPVRSPPSPRWLRPPVRSWPGSRGGPVSAAPSTAARCRTCCPGAARSPTTPLASRWSGSGLPASRPPPGANCPRSWRPPPVAACPRSSSAASTPPTCPTRPPRWPRWPRWGSSSASRLRHSAVTELADVVLPVAPVAEKAGTFVTWEGRRRPFEATLTSTGALTDGRVLHALADELDVDPRPARRARHPRGAGPVRAVRCPGAGARGGRRFRTGARARLGGAGHLARADRRRADVRRRGQPGRNGQARPRADLADHRRRGGRARRRPDHVDGPAGAITVPAELADVPDRVVWLPTNARDSRVRADLGAHAGDVVTLTAAAGGAR